MFVSNLIVERKILPHHPLHPESSRRILCGRLPHPQPEPLIHEQGENPPCQRSHIPHRHQKPRLAFYDLLGDAADRVRHDRNAAGESFEDGGREGIVNGGVKFPTFGGIKFLTR